MTDILLIAIALLLLWERLENSAKVYHLKQWVISKYRKYRKQRGARKK